MTFHANCMKGQSLFSGKKIRKDFKMSSAKNFTQHAKHKTTAALMMEGISDTHATADKLLPYHTGEQQYPYLP